MNITKLTETYIDSHPSVKDCVRKGLINYSALTRKMSEDLGLDLKDNFDAILIACRRYYSKIKKEAGLEDKIIGILKKSKLEVKNKIMVAVVEKSIFFNHLLELQKIVKVKSEVFHIIEGSSTITLITSEDFKEEIKKLFKNKLIRLSDSLAEITLKSSEDMEQTPGVLAYLTSLLAENAINIVETMSTWTDTLFVIEENDIARVMEVLKF
ncbi:MAG: ACT domain-containing protein [Nanoarchaeota archaeon]|nr:ACT domain-containing protein [Nanoarchaeota archaeon]MBU1004940.1 ACT domain-containing protein [Nanoarchaeota archaeon]MBU1945614.1 ACT domain-containing protein [Nanoarchaeota archaeon]